METLGSREVYVNNWMSVREDEVRRSDGSGGIYGVVDKPDYALVIPLDGDQMRLVEQYRYPLGLRRWEFPQGTAPERAHMAADELAVRELQEETGLSAASMVEIGLLDVAPGLTSQRGRVFLATELSEGDHAREVEEQDMRTAWFTRSDFEELVSRGEITDAQSIAAYAQLLLHERGTAQQSDRRRSAPDR